MNAARWVGFATLFAARVALAGSGSLLTVGVGTSFGFVKTAATSADITADLDVRLRVLRGVGLDLAYNPTPLRDTVDSAVADPDLRLGLLMYIAPTQPLGAYLKVGVAAPTMRQALSFAGDATTYSAGGGVEMYVGEHLALGAEAAMLIPPARTALDARTRDLGSGRRAREIRLSRSSFSGESYRAVFIILCYW